MSDMRFEFEHLKLQPAYRDRTYLLRDVVGDLTIVVDNHILFSESEFPILELATTLARWLANSPASGRPFRFSSMDAEESPLIEFIPGRGGWFFRSAWQGGDQKEPLTRTGLVAGAEAYVMAARTRLLEELGLDVSESLDEASRNADTSEDWSRSIDQ